MMGALNDHLLPVNEEPPQNDSTLKGKVLTSGAGTSHIKLSVKFGMCSIPKENR